MLRAALGIIEVIEMYKFRGKRIDTNDWVYGNLLQGAETHIVTANGEYKVYPNSIAQYLFSDINGKEVYDGDVVISQDNIEFMVHHSYRLQSLSPNTPSSGVPRYRLK